METSVCGPKGRWLVGSLPDFGRDPLGFLENCARNYGDFVTLRFFNRTVLLINDPRAIEQVLATQHRNFQKTLGYRTPFMRRLFGQGLLVSEGPLWTRQRRLAQPAFHRERIAGYASTIVTFTDRLAERWESGEVRDIHAEMLRLTTQVVTKTLFNAAVPPEIEKLGSASEAVMAHFTNQWSIWRMLLSLLPSPGKRRFDQVMERLDDYIFNVIRERRASGDTGDLLSMLLIARDENGNAMSDQQLRDELTTLMVAGLDTTALALSWGFYLLARHPAVATELADEIAEVLGERAPAFEDLPRLKFTECVMKETMRLYPPAWIVGREAIADCEVEGRAVKKGTSVIMSQWLMHRDPRHFTNVDQFEPARWGVEENKLPKFAYFPFGGGPRVCIGNSFAMMEAMLVTARLMQRFRFSPQSTMPILPWASITLQPRGGIPLRIEHRRVQFSPVS